MDNFAVISLGLISVSGQQRKTYKNELVIHSLNCSIHLELLLCDLLREKTANIWDVPNCVSLANLCSCQQSVANAALVEGLSSVLACGKARGQDRCKPIA